MTAGGAQGQEAPGRALEAFRSQAIATAARLFSEQEHLPHWGDSEYMEGICAVLAGTFGVSDPVNARSEIWDEIKAEHDAAMLRRRAEAILDRHTERRGLRQDATVALLSLGELRELSSTSPWTH